MSVGILEECHPKVVVVHLRYAVRMVCERNTTFFERGDCQCDVGAAEIDAALRSEAGCVLCFFEQQTYSRTVKERQVAEPIQLPQPDHVLIERFSTINIGDRERYLADVIEVECHDGTSIGSSYGGIANPPYAPSAP